MDTLKCSSCGAALQVDSDEKYIVCDFCGSTNVNTYARPKNHLEELKDDDISRAYAYIKNGNFFIALSEFKDFADRNPNDYRGYWGMVAALTHEFNYLDIPDPELKDAQKYYEKALIAANASQKKKLSNAWNEYINKLEDKSKAHQRRLQSAFDILTKEDDGNISKQTNFAISPSMIAAAIAIVLNASFIIYLISTNIGAVLCYASTFTPFLKTFLGLFINIIICIVLCLIFKSKICAKLVSITPVIFGILTTFWPLFYLEGESCMDAVIVPAFYIALIGGANYGICWLCGFISESLEKTFNK